MELRCQAELPGKQRDEANIEPVGLAAGGFEVDAADLRRAIEIEATRLACARRTVEDVESLRTSLQRRSEALSEGPGAGFQNADYQFHRTVVRCADNALLDELFHCLASQVKAPIDDTADNPSIERRHLAHAEVVDAISLGDEMRAIQAALVHLDVIVKEG